MRLVLLLFVTVYSAVGLSDDPSIVVTKYGSIQGVVDKDVGVRKFLGIPYTEPPTGTNRWKAPVPKAPWNGVLSATAFGECCPQVVIDIDPALTFNEDCLFMNIYTPLTAPPPSGFPVMFFIHGGGFVFGCTSQRLFYGDYFANTTDVILVTINYRLGALGFYYSSQTGVSGNFGILDQIQALKFTQDIIGNFGGDPNKVTIFGQSAGAMSVVIHLVSPLSYQNNYFHSAIVESNPVTLKFRTQEQAESHSELFAALVGCGISNLTCFLRLSPEFMVKMEMITVEIPTSPSLALTALPWEPIIDNFILSDQPLTLFSQNKFYDVPMIFGTTQNETAFFTYSILNGLNLTKVSYVDFVSLVGLFFEEHTLDLLALYPPSSDSTHSAIRLMTDYVFVCPTRFLAKFSSQKKSTWIYSFTWMSAHDCINNEVIQCSENNTVCHAAELSFVFNTEEFYGHRHTDLEQQLGMQILKAWTDFASGKLDTTFWPTFSQNHSALMLGIPTHVENYFDEHNCDYFDKIGYDW